MSEAYRYWQEMAARLPQPKLNGDSHYRMLARKQGLPPNLIDAVIRECQLEHNRWSFDLFQKVAKATNKDFWNKADQACGSNTGALKDLNWILCGSGSHAHPDHLSDAEKKLRSKTKKAIRNLKGLLNQQPEAKQLGFVNLLLFDDSGSLQIQSSAISDVDRLVAFVQKPTPIDLLNCLTNAIECDYNIDSPHFKGRHPQELEVKSKRSEVRYREKNENDPRANQMMYEMVKWFRRYKDRVPKAAVVAVSKAVFAKMPISATHENVYKHALAKINSEK